MRLVALLVLCLFLISCKGYEGGEVEGFPPYEFCMDSGGEWKKVPKGEAHADLGIFDVDNHPDYNHQCFCPEGTTWEITGCVI